MFQASVELLDRSGGGARASWVERRGTSRVPSDIAASIRARGSRLRLKVQVVDLSTAGCKLRSTDYQVGDEVLIALANLAPIIGRVQWFRDGAAGVKFGGALHPSVVEHLSGR